MIVKNFTFVTYLLMAAMIIIGHVRLSGTRLARVGPIQYFLHTLYAIGEPLILRITDYLLSKRFITTTAIGIAFLRLVVLLSHFLPHGIIITTKAAEKFFDYIENIEGPAGARIAVGPCVCQRALNKWKEPTCKDIVILYGADIYYHLNLGYRIISAVEAKTIVRNCHREGLVHSLDFCVQSGKWAFVICNCDRDICALTRVYSLTGKFLYPGPEVVTVERKKCRGEKKCGRCVAICMFGATSSTGETPVVDYARCLGCGQCVRVCMGSARSMSRRAEYSHDKVIPAELLLG
jgi:ferredoxin